MKHSASVFLFQPQNPQFTMAKSMITLEKKKYCSSAIKLSCSKNETLARGKHGSQTNFFL